MKKLITMFGVFLFASLVFTSCGSTDAKDNGKDAGELSCEVKELNKEKKELREKCNKLNWEKGSEDDREEIADFEKDKNKIDLKIQKLNNEIWELKQNQWSATEKKDDQEKWLKAYNEAEEAASKECKD